MITSCIIHENSGARHHRHRCRNPIPRAPTPSRCPWQTVFKDEPLLAAVEAVQTGRSTIGNKRQIGSMGWCREITAGRPARFRRKPRPVQRIRNTEINRNMVFTSLRVPDTFARFHAAAKVPTAMTAIQVQAPPLALDPATSSTLLQTIIDTIPYIPNSSERRKPPSAIAAFALVAALDPRDPVQAMLRRPARRRPPRLHTRLPLRRAAWCAAGPASALPGQGHGV